MEGKGISSTTGVCLRLDTRKPQQLVVMEIVNEYGTSSQTEVWWACGLDKNSGSAPPPQNNSVEE